MFPKGVEEKKLDWMYKGANSTVDREEYLLGRCVDKTLEELNAKEKQQGGNPINQPKNHVEHECIPPSIRDFKKLQLDEQVDLVQKLQEDPLIAIKKREEESRQKLLQNPVQLKKIQKIIKSRSGEKEKGGGGGGGGTSYASEKLTTTLLEKYMKTKHKIGTTTVSAEDNLDRIIAKKILSLMRKFTKVDFDTILNMFSDVDDTDDERIMKKKKRKRPEERSESETAKKKKNLGRPENRTRKRRRRRRRRRDSDSSSSHENRYKKCKSNLARAKTDKKKNEKKKSLERWDARSIKRKGKSSDSSSGRRSSSSSSSSCYCCSEGNSTSSGESDDGSSNGRPRKHYGLLSSDGTKIQKVKSRTLSTEKADAPATKEAAAAVAPTHTKTVHKITRKKLSEEEIEKRRREMMDNAEWRDTERTKNVNKYRTEEKEQQQQQESKSHSHHYHAEFIKKELIKSANSSTVESRIKANINNIQRSRHDMNKHFSRR